uniref:Armadillo repeat-containing domain-containing protein n=1 Tax=Aureoumbra lagunensis TaxID=44058 RepID=A0A7S3JVI0_9STRA
MLNNNGREAEVAARTLWKISRDGDNKKAIVHANAIPPLVNLLSSGTANAKEYAAAVLCNLLYYNENNKAAIVHANAIIPPLVNLLSSGTAKAKENAAGVLCYIAFKNENNKAAIVHANAIPPLVTLAKSGSLMIAKKL